MVGFERPLPRRSYCRLKLCFQCFISQESIDLRMWCLTDIPDASSSGGSQPAFNSLFSFHKPCLGFAILDSTSLSFTVSSAERATGLLFMLWPRPGRLSTLPDRQQLWILVLNPSVHFICVQERSPQKGSRIAKESKPSNVARILRCYASRAASPIWQHLTVCPEIRQ